MAGRTRAIGGSLDFTSNLRWLGLCAVISMLALPLKSYALIDPGQLGMDPVTNFAVYAKGSLTEGSSPAPTITGDVGQNIGSIDTEVNSVSAYAALQSPTLTFTTINTSTTITGNGGYNVISLSRISYLGSQVLTLKGGPNDVFVFNVGLSLNFSGANSTPIVLSGVATNHVLFNLLNTQNPGANALNASAANVTLFGTFIAPSASILLASDDNLYGGVFAGGNSLTLNSGSTIMADVFVLPEPSSFALVAIACPFGLGLWSRRRQRR